MATKICSRCKQEKPTTEFGVDSRRGIFKAVCRPCDSAIPRAKRTDEQKAQLALRAAERYAVNKAKGKCHICGDPCYGRIYCDTHRRELAEKAKLARKQRERFCPSCKTAKLDYRRKLCVECAATTWPRFRSYQKSWREGKKREAFEHYGGAICACCGESGFGFLTIDHVNSDGANHRREIFSNTSRGRGRIYGWLRSHGYPPGFQILCFNCNCGRQHNGGICPHKIPK